MSQIMIPKGYRPILDLYETQVAIGNLRHIFQNKLALALNVKRVSAPLFVDPGTGLNDDLNGVERPVAFDIPEIGNCAQVVHSLAKWKRMALYQYGFSQGEGIYTDMNAIRRDETLTNLHSIYVDQWDWEKILPDGRRDIEYLKESAQKVIDVLCDTEVEVSWMYPALKPSISREVSFVTTQELEDLYPNKTPKEREDIYTKEHPTTFLMQIGDVQKSGQRHDGRAPDYDDWTLNGDILVWNSVLERAIEISSMGIRVDAATLDRQLRLAHCDERRKLPFHKALLEGVLPQTIGGGIGQSRVCMLILKKAHIGEVQTSIWDTETSRICRQAGVPLL